ncbi:MAG: sugar ABC transporter permease [Chloroflexi bacterium]|nr:sugar ABC transporter permease [Chloroflexota bacterium]
MAASIFLSLTKYDILTEWKWVGLRNYGDALIGIDQAVFWQSLSVTAIYAVTSVPLQMVGAFLVALLMNQNVRGIYGFRVIYYIPAVTSGIASAILWKFVFSMNYGILNYLLSLLGIEPVPWLASTEWALPSLVIMSVWGFGGAMIIYLAGFKSIPEQLYEAAQLDGAGTIACFWHVTIPMVSPVIFFNLIMGVIGSFQVFTSAFAMTGGGPARATYFYMLYLYQVAFRDFRMGYASALAWILFIIIATLTYLTFRTAGSRVYYEGGKLS